MDKGGVWRRGVYLSWLFSWLAARDRERKLCKPKQQNNDDLGAAVQRASEGVGLFFRAFFFFLSFVGIYRI